MRNTTNELYHHGILGQKWGKRNGPPYPIEASKHSVSEKRAGWQNSLESIPKDFYRESSTKIKKNMDGSTTFPKGFVLNRVGKNTTDVRTNKTGGLFVSYGKADAARYIKIYGPDLCNAVFRNTREAIQHISVTKPICLPSESQTVSETGKFLKENPKAVDALKNDPFTASLLSKKTTKLTAQNIDRMISNPDALESKQIAYVANMTMVLADNFESFIKSYYAHFRKCGYDAVPDLHDIYDGASETPMIIINPEKVKVTETTVLTKEVYKAGKDYVKEIGKLPISDVYKKL